MLEQPGELVLDVQIELVRLRLQEAQVHLELHVVAQEPPERDHFLAGDLERERLLFSLA